jgi:enoyl-CoA hydratase/carnithine racemase
MTDDAVLTQERHGAVVIATLNRPKKGNSLSRPLIDALEQLAADIETGSLRTDGPRALVITGAGTSYFSAGADVNELDGIDGVTARNQMRRGQAVFDRLEQLPVAVIAAINGFALGGGLELAMAADIRIASSTARLGQPEITLGNLPGWGGTQRLPRLVGRSRATELILTGEILSAERAYELGLVNHIAADCVAEAIDLAGRIAERSTTAVRGAKHAIRVGLEQGVVAGLRAEADAVAACCETEEQKEAVRAFLNRRTVNR